jgi:hypothetical protein
VALDVPLHEAGEEGGRDFYEAVDEANAFGRRSAGLRRVISVPEKGKDASGENEKGCSEELERARKGTRV